MTWWMWIIAYLVGTGAMAWVLGVADAFVEKADKLTAGENIVAAWLWPLTIPIMIYDIIHTRAKRYGRSVKGDGK